MKKNDVLWSVGTECEYCFFIVEGRFQLLRPGETSNNLNLPKRESQTGRKSDRKGEGKRQEEGIQRQNRQRSESHGKRHQ